jgi:AraC-like DNA-binding protein
MRIHKCGFLTYPPATIIGPIVVDTYGLVWMDEGSCEVVVGEEHVTLTERDFILCPPGVAATYSWATYSRPTRMGFLYFHSAPDLRWRLSYHVPEDDIVPPLMRHLLWLAQTQPDDWEASLSSTATYILEVLSTGHSGTDLAERPQLSEPIERVMSYLSSIWANGPMRSPSLEELARSARVGPEHLSRIFTRELDHPPLLTLRLLRVHRAATLLRQTDMSVRAIAFECGWTNEYHFSEAFRARAGVPPTQYRASPLPSLGLPPKLAQIGRYLGSYSIERFPNG